MLKTIEHLIMSRCGTNWKTDEISDVVEYITIQMAILKPMTLKEKTVGTTKTQRLARQAQALMRSLDNLNVILLTVLLFLLSAHAKCTVSCTPSFTLMHDIMSL